jgi:hypothetical protein
LIGSVATTLKRVNRQVGLMIDPNNEKLGSDESLESQKVCAMRLEPLRV